MSIVIEPSAKPTATALDVPTLIKAQADAITTMQSKFNAEVKEGSIGDLADAIQFLDTYASAVAELAYGTVLEGR